MKNFAIPRGRLAAFFDWDGTLSPDGRVLAPGNAEAIAKWRAAGHLAILATGRANVWMPTLGVETCCDGLLAGAGAYVKLGDRFLIRRCIEPADLTRFITFFLREGKTTCVFEGETSCFVLNNNGGYPPENNITAETDFAAAYPNEVITKMTVPQPEIGEDIIRLFDGYDLIYNPTWIEIVPKGCSKAAGMYALLDELGIPHENSIAFGDSGNDYDILCAAGIGVAMPHAPKRCLEAAAIVAPATAEGGVGKVLTGILEKTL